MTEEDEAFNDIERQAKQRKEAVRATTQTWRESASDYERGVIDGMQKQMQSSVDKAVNRMAQTQEPKIGCVNHDCDKCKTQTQEPVAWFRYQQGSRVYYDSKKWDDCQPLYTTPPQRTWVGLTRDEQSFVYSNLHNATSREDSFWVDFANAIEAKLKEKNT